MRATTEKKKARKMSGLKKALLIALGALALAALIFAAWYLIRFQFYDVYRDALKGAYAIETGTAFEPLPDARQDVPGMALAAQNDTLKLYADEKTACVAVYDRRNGVTVYSNPQDAQNDPVANKTNVNYLRSQFILEYYNAARTAGIYDSYSMSVARGQVSAERIENGVRFNYYLGEKKKPEYYVPYYLSAQKLDEILSKVSEADASALKRLYTASDNGLYALIKTGRTNLKSQARIDAILQKTGFTADDYDEQMALGGETGEESIGFCVSLEYRLKADALEVSLPVSAVSEAGGAKLSRIQLLRSFGAAGTEETGYLVVPNGSGSLIRFNNGKTGVAAYSQYVYGTDLIDADYTKTQNTQTARLPILGICRENSSVLLSVERGAPLCMLSADVAGRYNSFNTAYATFVLRGYDVLSMFGVSGGEADMPILETDLYDEDITVRYTLLTDEFKGYSGLADYYRGRLMSEGKLTRKQADGDIPFYCDVIGGVRQTAHFLGVSYQRVYPMTTFSQAETMARALKDAGISNQVMNLQGWQSGGYYHDAANGAYPLSSLGGQKGLEALNDTLVSLGGELYADVAFQNVTMLSGHYVSSLESARYYGSGYTAVLGQVNPGTLRRTASLYYEETLYSLLSPKFLPRYVAAFSRGVQGIRLGGISLRDLGDELHADKRRTNVISRQQALDVVDAQFKTLAQTGRALMVSGGNDYALPYASHVIGAPLRASEYFIVDETIPLYEMIVHGCAGYAGLPLNCADSADARTDLLRLIEYGASCRYIFTFEDSAQMKYTGLNRYYATTFSAWKDEAAATYKTLNDALSPVKSALMIRHETLENGVVRVCYDNGLAVYVNYGTAARTADGYELPPRSSLTAAYEKEAGGQ